MPRDCARTIREIIDRLRDLLLSAIAVGAVSSVLGCASIVSGRYADVAIDSYPSNAHVMIRDADGRTVASLQTPGVVSLKRSRRYFLPARYSATIEAPGYQPTHVPLASTLNPWIFGNVIIGGIPGIVIDSATGAAWRPRDSEVFRQLPPLYQSPADGSYSGEPPLEFSMADRAEAAADRR
jgi:hypothetical protein